MTAHESPPRRERRGPDLEGAPKVSRQWWRDRWRNALVLDESLSSSCRCVAFVIKEYASKGTRSATVQVSQQRLAAESNAGLRTVQRALGLLEARQWLVENEPSRRDAPTVYALTFPPDWDATLTPQDSPLGRHHDTQTPSDGAPTTTRWGANHDTMGRQPDAPYQEEIKKDQSPRTPAANARDLLGWAEDDERLESVDSWLNAMGARHPGAYLGTCHRNGNLDSQLSAFHAKNKPGPQLETWTDPNKDVIPAAPEVLSTILEDARAKLKAGQT